MRKIREKEERRKEKKREKERKKEIICYAQHSTSSNRGTAEHVRIDTKNKHS